MHESKLRRIQGIPKLDFIDRRKHDHVRNASQIRQIECAMMRCAIFANKSRTVKAENDGQILECYIVNNLVVSTLKECRIDIAINNHALCCHSCGKRNGMLLGDPDVERALRKLIHHQFKRAAGWHGRRDADDFFVASCKLQYCDPENILIFWRKVRFAFNYKIAASFVKLAGSVIFHLIRFGLAQPFPLCRDHMQELRARNLFKPFELIDQCSNIVSVDRSRIIEIERPDHIVVARIAAFLDRCQIVLQRSDARVDADRIVVEDHKQIRIGDAGVVQSLKCHSRCDRSIAYNCNMLPFKIAIEIRSDRHSKRCRNRR